MSLDNLQALADPVRHEANNLLAALSGTIDILLRTATTDRDRARATRLREATDRLEALIKAYVSLAAPPVGDDGTDGAKLLTVMRPLLVLTLGPGRAVEIEAAPGLPLLATAPATLQAHVLRLAQDAAAQSPPGSSLRIVLSAAPHGAMLAAETSPGGATTPTPVLLPSAGS